MTRINKNLLLLACTALGTTTICLTQATAKAATISVNYGNGARIAFPGNGAVFNVGQQVNFRLDAPWSVSGTGPGNVVVRNELVVGGATLSSVNVYTDSVTGPFAASAYDERYASYTFTSPGTYTAFGRLTGSINPTSTATTSSTTFSVQDVPEPLTILGSITALGFGISLKRKQTKATLTRKMC
jgi:hypothetical protein